MANQQYDQKELERYKIDLEHKRSLWTTGFNSLISLTIFNIGLLAKVSGAAIVGLFTIFGHAWLLKTSLPKEIICTLSYYFIALGAAVLCGIVAYVFQVIELETNKKCVALCIRIFACVLAMISFSSLAYGSYIAVEVFSKINSSIIQEPKK